MLPRKGTNCCGMPEFFEHCERIRECPTFVERELGLWIRRSGHEFDPFATTSVMDDINLRFLFFNITGSFITDEGILRGLRTLHVAGECFRANNREDRMRFDVELGAGALEFECIFGLRVLGFKPPLFTLHLDIDYIEVYIDFCYNFTFGLEGVIHELFLKDAKGMRLWISGLGYWDWILNQFLKLVTRYYKRSILDWLREEVVDEIYDGFYRFQFPYSFINPQLI